jgi:hypothetical protein
MNIRRLVWFGEKLCAVNAAMLPRAASSSAGDPATWLPVSYSQPGPVQLDQLRLVYRQQSLPPFPSTVLASTVAGSFQAAEGKCPPTHPALKNGHTSDISTGNLLPICDLSLIEMFN